MTVNWVGKSIHLWPTTWPFNMQLYFIRSRTWKLSVRWQWTAQSSLFCRVQEETINSNSSINQRFQKSTGHHMETHWSSLAPIVPRSSIFWASGPRATIDYSLQTLFAFTTNCTREILWFRLRSKWRGHSANWLLLIVLELVHWALLRRIDQKLGLLFAKCQPKRKSMFPKLGTYLATERTRRQLH